MVGEALAPSQPKLPAAAAPAGVAKRKAAPRPRNAAAWLRRPRQEGGLAEEYYQKEALKEAAMKKPKVELTRGSLMPESDA